MENINKFLPVPTAPTEEAIQKSINFCEKSPNGILKVILKKKKLS